MQLTLPQTSPGLYVSAVQVFWGYWGKKEKLLVMSNFSFSHIAFYTSGKLFAINFQLSFANFLSLEECKLCHMGKGLNSVVWY